jgi:hypothetical protein
MQVTIIPIGTLIFAGVVVFFVVRKVFLNGGHREDYGFNAPQMRSGVTFLGSDTVGGATQDAVDYIEVSKVVEREVRHEKKHQ